MNINHVDDKIDKQQYVRTDRLRKKDSYNFNNFEICVAICGLLCGILCYALIFILSILSVLFNIFILLY